MRSMACKPRLNNAARTTYGDCNEGGSESSDWDRQLVALRSAFRRRRGTDVKCIGLGRSAEAISSVNLVDFESISVVIAQGSRDSGAVGQVFLVCSRASV